MLALYIVGAILYLTIGFAIGQMGWHVWGRDVRFLNEFVNHNLNTDFNYQINQSLGMQLLFPVAAAKDTCKRSDVSNPIIYHWFAKKTLDERLRIIYVAMLGCLWPVKLAYSILTLVVALLGAMALSIAGLLSAPVEMIVKKDLTLTRYLSWMKRIALSRTLLGPVARRLTGAEKARKESNTKTSPQLPTARATYGQRLKELNDERSKAALRVAELDSEIADVTLEKDERQGGVFRASDSIVMPEPAESKRRAG